MTVFKSKAGAMSFAIMMCTTICAESGVRTVDYDEAQKLYDFINVNVNLPDVERDPYAEMIASLPALVGTGAKTGNPVTGATACAAEE